MRNTNSVGSLISSPIVDYTNNHAPPRKGRNNRPELANDLQTDFGDIIEYIYRKVEYSDDGIIGFPEVVSANLIIIMMALAGYDLARLVRRGRRFLKEI